MMRDHNAAALDWKNWRGTLAGLRAPENSRILGGSITMLTGSGLVSVINFAYNIAVARMLGPAAFGHAAAAVTLLMLLSAVTLAYQLVCAKFVARNETPGAKAAVYRSLRRKAWYVALAIGSLLMLGSTIVAHYLHLPDGSLVVILALGITFYIPLGAKRGALQGVCAFRRLTLNFILETSVKLIAAILLVHAGFGVYGAVAAISVSVIAAYFLPPVTRELEAADEQGIPASFREGMQAIVFFVGQVIINNSDILLVKHFFDAQLAGLYAAVALVGRVVCLLAWSVVSAMFPISAAGTQQEEEKGSVLVLPLLLVLAIALAFTVGLGLFPEFALRTLFGPSFHDLQIESLLTLCAASAGIYSLSVVLIAYEMSRRISMASWIQLLFSLLTIARFYFFHATLRQVVVTQLVLMVGLLIAAALPFFRAGFGFSQQEVQVDLAARRAVKRLRRLSESEVIAAFLQNEFYHREFDRDRERFRDVVLNADLQDPLANELRKSLLYRRRDGMWRELPQDTQWWEVELSPEDLDRIHIFPRAQWRRVAQGNFLLRNVAGRMRTDTFQGRTRAFVQKIAALSSHLLRHDDGSMIMMIASDEYAPMTVIEGNHRMTAAMLAGPDMVFRRFRVVCGFSPRMNEVCWYRNNLPNLTRYALRRFRMMIYDPETEIERVAAACNATEAPQPAKAVREDPLTQKTA